VGQSWPLPHSWPMAARMWTPAGGSPDNSLIRGTALLNLGYRVMVFVDADKPSTAGLAEAFLAAGGQILTWRPGLTLEDEIFRHLSEQALDALLAKAETIVGAELMNAHIQTKSQGRVTPERYPRRATRGWVLT